MENNAASKDAFTSPTSPSMTSTFPSLNDDDTSSNLNTDSNTNILSLDTIRVAKSLRSKKSQPPSPDVDVPQPPSLLTTSSSPEASPEPEPEQPTKRIPRPPNAFMLYRSDWLKQNHIPANVERRQQALSCVAGECWNMLSAEEKQKWQAKAAEAYQQHQLKYPGYKFTPAAKGHGKKGKGKSEVTDSAVRELREKYVRMPGPAVPPARRRRAKKAKGHRVADDARSDHETRSEPSRTPALAHSTVPLPLAQPAPMPLYPYAPSQGATLPAPEFPSPSMPYYFQDHRPIQLSSGHPDVQHDSYYGQLPPIRAMSVPIPGASEDFHHNQAGDFELFQFPPGGGYWNNDGRFQHESALRYSQVYPSINQSTEHHYQSPVENDLPANISPPLYPVGSTGGVYYTDALTYPYDEPRDN